MEFSCLKWQQLTTRVRIVSWVATIRRGSTRGERLEHSRDNNVRHVYRSRSEKAGGGPISILYATPGLSYDWEGGRAIRAKANTNGMKKNKLLFPGNMICTTSAKRLKTTAVIRM